MAYNWTATWSSSTQKLPGNCHSPPDIPRKLSSHWKNPRKLSLFTGKSQKTHFPLEKSQKKTHFPLEKSQKTHFPLEIPRTLAFHWKKIPENCHFPLEKNPRTLTFHWKKI